MRIVCDTSIAISGILWSGIPNQILKLGERGVLDICGTFETMAEFERVIKYEKFDKRIKELNLSVSTITDFYIGLTVLFEAKQIEKIIVKKDPDDDIFLEAALGSNSHFIVSGDEHLLKLEKYKDIFILSAKEFLDFCNISSLETDTDKRGL